MADPEDHTARGVRNRHAHQALAAFGTARDREHWVLAVRTLLQGRLLTDVTRAVRDPDDGAPFSISGGQTTDGSPVAFAYTDLAAVVAHTGVVVPEVVAPTAVGVLEMVARAPGTGLAVDPAGACLVLGPGELAAVLRGRRNTPVKEALVVGDHELLLRVLGHQLAAGDAVLLEAVTAPHEGAPVLTARLPDGRTAALAFTSPLEVEAVLPGSAYALRPLRSYLEHVRDAGRPGLVLDPAGPAATLTPDDLRRVLGG
ncbi:MAG: hypothetical protein JWQ53_44 [Klenkia sp.]|nr:hypothetical protein [Klenkia sp.]